MPSVQSIVDDLRQNASRYATTDDSDSEAREKLLDGARSLIAELETPNEFVTRTTWAEPARNAALKILIESGLLEHFTSSTPNGQSTSTVNLAQAIGGEENHVWRVMRHLVAMNLVVEVTPDRFTPTPLLRRLAEPRFVGGLVVGYECLGPGLQKLPEFVKERGYHDSTDCRGAAFHAAIPSAAGLQAYVWMQTVRPEVGKGFHQYMTGYRFGVPKWFNEGFYPVQDRLGHPDLGTDEAPVLIVDVAGGLGADISEFIDQHGSSLPGRIVLEDISLVIDAANASSTLNRRIEPMIFDLFEPQPVKGARAYHLHSILHNWPDKECHDILNNVAAAMRPRFSRLLIFEQLIPEKDARWGATSEDFVMNVMFSARERKEVQWIELLKPHGLKITGIWSVPGGEESLIEAELTA